MRNRLLALALLSACGSSDPASPDGGGGDGGAPDGGVIGCPRDLAPEGPRRVLVSQPYDAEGGQAPAYRVLALDADGALTDTGETFALGRATTGEIAFTPDGALAFVPQEDGTIGVVAFDEGGARVVDAGVGGVYAASVQVAPTGDTLYVLDAQWRENGGGLYAMAIGCDGALGAPNPVVIAKLPEAFFALPGDRLLLVARDAADSTTDRDAHLLAMGGAAPTVLDSVDAFPDDDALVSSAALTHDGQTLLIADNSELSGIPNRIAAITLAGDDLAARQILTPIEDPFDVIASPFGGDVLVVSGYGDALFHVAYAPGDEEPLSIVGELDYVAPGPMLPADAVMIDRGPLRGLVLIAEVGGVRRARFLEGGGVEDLGVTVIGEGGVADLIGAIGVAP